jgi:prepilin-type N-terminal cleavage/methylation domain-containing protein
VTARSRRGFTLVEVMLAIALTGIVAVLVYGASGIALDTEVRLAERELRLRSAEAWYAVARDALRNLRPSGGTAQPTLIVTPGTDPMGRPRDRLELITAGGTPPLTSDADWRMRLEVTERGLVLTARPIGVRTPGLEIAGMAGVTGLRVRVLDGRDEPGWLDAWNDPRLLPGAVEVTFWADSGPARPPLLVAIPMESVR